MADTQGFCYSHFPPRYEPVTTLIAVRIYGMCPYRYRKAPAISCLDYSQSHSAGEVAEFHGERSSSSLLRVARLRHRILTSFKIQVFRLVLIVNSDSFPDCINRLASVAET